MSDWDEERMEEAFDVSDDEGLYSGEHDLELAVALAYRWWKERINERGGFLHTRERQAFSELSDMGARHLYAKMSSSNNPDKILYHALRGPEEEEA